jgi:polysaccharide chain length determinant protein (PEP-CTERM system associated)
MLGHRNLNADDYLAILKRRGWIIAIPAVLLTVAAFAATFFIAPRYVSQTLVIIDSQKVPDAYVKPVISSDLDARLASMKEQILSRSRIQPIIERYNLYATNHMSMDDRVDTVRRAIGIKPIASITHSGGLPGFYIIFESSDAHTAQLVCSEITSLFLSENMRSREASAQGTTDFLKDQLADAKRSLDDQDEKLAAFQRQNFGKLPGEETTSVNMLTSLNTQLEAANQALARLEQDKSYEEAMLAQQAQISSAGSAALPQSVAPQTEEIELQALLAQEADLTTHYTADYPDVIAVRRKIADLRKQISADAVAASKAAAAPIAATASASAPSRLDSVSVQQLRAQVRATDMGIQSKRAEQAQIEQSVRTYQSRIQSTPQVEEEFKKLTRDYQTAQGFYDSLLGKMNESKMATDLERHSQGEQFRIMDEANLPEGPTYPKPTVFAGGGLIAGLTLGIMIVAFLEYKDTSLRTERDVAAFTGLPTLAVIAWSPDISTSKSERFPWLHRLFRRKAEPTKLVDVNG